MENHPTFPKPEALYFNAVKSSLQMTHERSLSLCCFLDKKKFFSPKYFVLSFSFSSELKDVTHETLFTLKCLLRKNFFS